LARPHQLDGALRLPCQQRRFNGVVRERTPPETSAKIALMDVDLVGLQLERSRDEIAAAAEILRSIPHLDLVAGVIESRNRVQWLHLRVIGVVASIFGLVDLRSTG